MLSLPQTVFELWNAEYPSYTTKFLDYFIMLVVLYFKLCSLTKILHVWYFSNQVQLQHVKCRNNIGITDFRRYRRDTLNYCHYYISLFNCSKAIAELLLMVMDTESGVKHKLHLFLSEILTLFHVFNKLYQKSHPNKKMPSYILLIQSAASSGFSN